MRNAFRQVPKEIEESAIVDGAGTGSLLRLMLPLPVPRSASIPRLRSMTTGAYPLTEPKRKPATQ